MSEQNLTLKCLGHTKRDAGLIGRYHLEVTDTRSGRMATVFVEPKQLASARSMKTILLDRCMFYSVTQKAHDQMLHEMFAQANDRAEIEDSREPGQKT